MKPRILIVEDNPDNRMVLTWRLRKIGDFEIRQVTNGREALEAVATQCPDLILMDLKMPVLDGWEATRRIRSREVGTRVPIIAVTAQVGPNAARGALAAGCDAYLSKPYSCTQLRDTIAAFLVLGGGPDSLAHSPGSDPGVATVTD